MGAVTVVSSATTAAVVASAIEPKEIVEALLAATTALAALLLVFLGLLLTIIGNAPFPETIDTRAYTPGQVKALANNLTLYYRAVRVVAVICLLVFILALILDAGDVAWLMGGNSAAVPALTGGFIGLLVAIGVAAVLAFAVIAGKRVAPTD